VELVVYLSSREIVCLGVIVKDPDSLDSSPVGQSPDPFRSLIKVRPCPPTPVRTESVLTGFSTALEPINPSYRHSTWKRPKALPPIRKPSVLPMPATMSRPPVILSGSDPAIELYWIKKLPRALHLGEVIPSPLGLAVLISVMLPAIALGSLTISLLSSPLSVTSHEIVRPPEKTNVLETALMVPAGLIWILTLADAGPAANARSIVAASAITMSVALVRIGAPFCLVRSTRRCCLRGASWLAACDVGRARWHAGFRRARMTAR
jgi:hypothetical protein